jgi:hypothetical protein
VRVHDGVFVNKTSAHLFVLIHVHDKEAPPETAGLFLSELYQYKADIRW